MRRLNLYSEPYGTTGNIGQNFRRLLGAPSLDPLQTVIREAIQNVSDAAKLGYGPEILIRLRTLTNEQRSVLKSVILNELPREQGSQELLRNAIDKPELVVLEICDFRTTGLGGPTRSDRIPVGTKHTDFIDFLRNIGTPRDTDHGGGTYGFGKVSLYSASSCSTILVDTLPCDGNADERRLIGCHVGSSFNIPQNEMLKRFTGRHWWGWSDPEDGVVDPVTGPDARELSKALGMPERPDGATGTSIMILDFEADDESLRATGQRIVETLLWNFWPRMMRDVDESRRIDCKVEVDGEKLYVPKPEEFPPFDLFCKAMRAARSRDGNDVRAIKSKRPAKELGTLSMERGLRSPRHHLVASDSLIPTLIRHIALMRPVELVVKYLEGSPLADDRLEWAGVFLTSEEDEIERAFADSEPPAHDDWVPDNLARGYSKTYVNVAMKRLRSIAAEAGMEESAVSSNASYAPPLASVAGRLGMTLESVGGDGAGKRRQKRVNGRTTSPKSARATRPVFDRLFLSESHRIAVFTTEVIQDANKTGMGLSTTVLIAIDGGIANKLDDEIGRPVIKSINEVGGPLASDSGYLQIDGVEGQFEIHVLLTDDYAVTVQAEVVHEAAL